MKCYLCNKILTKFEIEAGWFHLKECKEIAEVYCEHDHEYRPGHCFDKLPLCEECYLKTNETK